jgi:hypothetical protein
MGNSGIVGRFVATSGSLAGFLRAGKRLACGYERL